MNYILFDDKYRNHLLPLTFTRPVAELRIGITKISEKWQHFLKDQVSFLTEKYLSAKFPVNISKDNILINAGIIPNDKLVKAISELELNEVLIAGEECIAAHLSKSEAQEFSCDDMTKYKLIDYNESFLHVKYPYDIFTLNGECLIVDYKTLTQGRVSSEINPDNKIIAPENVFVEKGAKLNCCIINASEGPVYIGRNAEIMEGSIIRGPFALCESSTVKMAAKIYGPTTIGPHSKVGGELNNVVIQAYSNKGHDGFLGNAVIGEWCNLGADTNNSNLKNNYAEVRLWNYVEERFKGTNLQFCGLIMGDHSKCGINTMFNTGTVVGVFANLYGAGFIRNFAPSFAWGGPQGFKTYNKTAAFYVAKLVMQRRNIEFSKEDKQILEAIFEQTAKYRKF